MSTASPSIDQGLPRPNITIQQAQEYLTRFFGLEATLKELGSQQDRNFLATASTTGIAHPTRNTRYLLKVSNSAFPLAEVESQNAIMQHLTAAGLTTPTPIASLAGEIITTVQIDGAAHSLRLLSFVEGEPLIDHSYLAPDVIGQLGTLAGSVSAHLAKFTHEGLDRTMQWDLRQGEHVVASLLGYVTDPAVRAQLTDALGRATSAIAPLVPHLPVQAIHGDLTDDNVVCSVGASGQPVVTGIIDFGDTMYSWRVAELAVACTAILHHEPRNPLAVLPLIRAFAERVSAEDSSPLTDAEISALWPLIVLRGAVLVVSGQQQVTIDPENDYASEALERERTIFETAARFEWGVAEASIRDALGRPNANLDPENPSFHPIMPTLTETPVAIVDYSYDGGAHSSGSWLKPGDEDRILASYRSLAPTVITRYGEARLTRTEIHSRDKPTNVSVSLAVHVAQPTPVEAPFAGTITYADATTVSISGDDHTAVFAGLSLLRGTALGNPVEAGMPLGVVGNVLTVWLLARDSDAQTDADSHTGAGTNPAALRRFVRASEFAGWASIYRDPAELLGEEVFPSAQKAQLVDPARELSLRSDSYATLQSHYYAAPPQIERGWKEHLIDTNGRHYLDMVNNVSMLGHGHPAIATAAADQWRRLNTNSRFHYGVVAELSQKLLAKLPDSFDAVLLVNSGSEAVDLALRLSKAFSRRQDVMCVRESYHGWSLASDAVSTSTSDNPQAENTRPSWVHVVDAPNRYRGIYRGDGAGARYAADALAELERLAADGTPIGTYIAEPRNGNAGGILQAPGYLSPVYDAVRAGGGVVISDEVQVGYGRLGEHFWGFEEHGVVPDIVTVAKAMGNGHPLGAVITRREIADALSTEGTFFSSSGGSTLSSRIGVTVLDVLEREDLQGNSREVGSYLLSELELLAERQPMIGTVHGRGLYLGVELVRDRSTLEPASEETPLICNRMRELGVIVQPTGDRQNVLKVKPPMCFTRESARFFVEALDEVLTTGW